MNFKGNFTYFLILALPIFVPTIVAAKIASQEIISGIEFGVQEEYDKAVKHFSELQQNHPTDPAPHFFIATLWQTRMMDFETQQWRDLFLSEIDTTIKLSQENLEQNPKIGRASCRERV